MKRNILLLLVIFIVSTMFFVGCSSKEVATENDVKTLADSVVIDDNTVKFVDAMGDEITLDKNPQKVICLYNSYLDLWYEAQGEVIGRIKTKGAVPEEAKDVEIVGTMSQPNAEKILSMQPDLVILTPSMKGQKEIIPILKDNKIPYLAVEYETFDEYMYIMRIFTALTNAEEAYNEKGIKIEKEINEIMSKIPTEGNPSVLLMFASTKSVKVKLTNSTVGAMLDDLKANNIAYDAKLTEEKMEIFSMEKIIERNPDYILVQTMGDVEKIKDKLIKDVESNPAWKSLTAVKEGRYIILPKDLYLYKANARYAEAYMGLAKILYPDIFK